MIFVIVVETRPDQGFVVYHIEYTPTLLTQHPEYMFFQDMLKSNVRYKISFFLQRLLKDGWVVIGQSQNNTSIFYTLSIHFDEDNSLSSLSDSLPEASEPVECE